MVAATPPRQRSVGSLIDGIPPHPHRPPCRQPPHLPAGRRSGISPSESVAESRRGFAVPGSSCGDRLAPSSGSSPALPPDRPVACPSSTSARVRPPSGSTARWRWPSAPRRRSSSVGARTRTVRGRAGPELSGVPGPRPLRWPASPAGPPSRRTCSGKSHASNRCSMLQPGWSTASSSCGGRRRVVRPRSLGERRLRCGPVGAALDEHAHGVPREGGVESRRRRRPPCRPRALPRRPPRRRRRVVRPRGRTPPASARARARRGRRPPPRARTPRPSPGPGARSFTSAPMTPTTPTRTAIERSRALSETVPELARSAATAPTTVATPRTAARAALTTPHLSVIGVVGRAVAIGRSVAVGRVRLRLPGVEGVGGALGPTVLVVGEGARRRTRRRGTPR